MDVVDPQVLYPRRPTLRVGLQPLRNLPAASQFDPRRPFPRPSARDCPTNGGLTNAAPPEPIDGRRAATQPTVNPACAPPTSPPAATHRHHALFVPPSCLMKNAAADRWSSRSSSAGARTASSSRCARWCARGCGRRCSSSSSPSSGRCSSSTRSCTTGCAWACCTRSARPREAGGGGGRGERRWRGARRRRGGRRGRGGTATAFS
jgi:hypothetical protein